MIVERVVGFGRRRLLIIIIKIIVKSCMGMVRLLEFEKYLGFGR